VSLDDIYNADLIFVVGQNPGTNHPRMLSALEQTKRNGGKIVAVNPLPGLLAWTDGTEPPEINHAHHPDELRRGDLDPPDEHDE
jgi:hypothetical protein